MAEPEITVTKRADSSSARRPRKFCALHPWLPWVAPFAVYIGVLGAAGMLPLDATGNHVLRILLVAPLILFCSLRLFPWTIRMPLRSIAVGAAVFVIWVGPEAIFPGYRSHWLFSNSVLGEFQPGGGVSASGSALFLALRVVVSVMLVPVLEELFWRGFLMRILIRNDFESVPLGAWSRDAFWIVAILFALEHGSHWDVGLAAGLIYNAWMLRTKSLPDLILAHAVTNGLLAAYVIGLGRWEFWP